MKKILLFLLYIVCSSTMMAKRNEVVIENWKFTHEDNDLQKELVIDEDKWENVKVPHDWAISGPFDSNIDKQVVAITQNGEKVASEKTGRTGSLPWIGVGWYRTHIAVSPKCERAILNFDGAMAEPVVYVNGRKAGEWKYGYSAFNVDITPYINKNDSDNVIAVRLENISESSRWYPGAGLYRPVKLITSSATSFDEWGLNCVTKAISQKVARVNVSAKIHNVDGKKMKVLFAMSLLGEKRSRSEADVTQVEVNVEDGNATAEIQVEGPKTWSPEHPNRYNLKAILYEETENGQMREVDVITKKVGIRIVKINKTNGFSLNGVTRKIKGVCLHHDLGMFGAAINKDALTRQIKLLKGMGCDAIRTAHNMPSQMQMDLCDSLGMMVMAESFDMWAYPKVKNGYNRFYKEWWRRDLANLVYANRLHPSIIMWSIGNEVPEQGMKDGTWMVKDMMDFMRILDPSRACTVGMDRVDNAISTGFAQTIDVPGLNYRTHRYESSHTKLPQGVILGSETASTISSRGVYKFPVNYAKDKVYDDGQCSGYDVECCNWSNVPEEDWVLQDDKKWVIGEFVWTGFDYLGEPTPYDGYAPARSSYFGIFDLAGLPKDRYWLYRSKWNTQEHTIHLLPHWTWPGRENQVTPVYCYTDYPTAELFVNGKSMGKRTKDETLKLKDGEDVIDDGPAFDRYRLRWNDVRYEPGELKVVAYDKNGNAAGEEIVRTAGKPHHLEMKIDKYEDLTFVNFYAVDKMGNVCPDADNLLSFKVKNGNFRGVCNGDATSDEEFTKPKMHLFKGQLVACFDGVNPVIKVKGKGVKGLNLQF